MHIYSKIYVTYFKQTETEGITYQWIEKVLYGWPTIMMNMATAWKACYSQHVYAISARLRFEGLCWALLYWCSWKLILCRSLVCTECQYFNDSVFSPIILFLALQEKPAVIFRSACKTKSQCWNPYQWHSFWVSSHSMYSATKPGIQLPQNEGWLWHVLWF